MPTQVTPERIAAQGREHSQVENIYPHFIHKRLEGKIAVVTGGAKGIGEATVKLFVQHGAKVVIADIDDAAGYALANSLSNTSSITFVHCDVSSEDDIKHLVDTTVSTYGRIDIFYNNAGILGSHKSIVDFDVNEFNRVMSVNVGGAGLGMKHAARVMIPRAAGCIISTASVAGVMGGTGPDAYTASKHAVVGLTKNVSCELGKYGIRVNCISPFGAATSLVVDEYKAKAKAAGAGAGAGDQVEEVTLRSAVEKSVERMGNLKGATLRAKDIAEAALYLASDESKYLSGHNLVVDGGYTSSKNYAGAAF